MSIIIFLLILSLLVLVHEFGHFFAAKKQGILVEEFGFGYPPRLLSIKIGETIYSLNLIPLGGFVKVYGEEYQEKISKKLSARSFSHKKPWQKALVLVAGILGNFFLGWLLISYLFTQGVPSPTNKIIVEQIVKNSPAALADIKEGDIVKSLATANNKITANLKNTDELINYSKKYAGQEIVLKIERNGKILNKKLVPRQKPPSGQGPLGLVITSFEEKKYPWYQAPFYGLLEALNITKKIAAEIIKMIVQFFSFKKPAVEVTGPIGIAHYTSQVIKFGKNAVLELIALLSLNLAIVNLLPFPALDGGRLVFVIYEWTTKRKVNKNFEKYLNLIGFIFLLTLAAVISVNDIIRLTK
jgi:regulator of sigma E protease